MSLHQKLSQPILLTDIESFACNLLYIQKSELIEYAKNKSCFTLSSVVKSSYFEKSQAAEMHSSILLSA